MKIHLFFALLAAIVLVEAGVNQKPRRRFRNFGEIQAELERIMLIPAGRNLEDFSPEELAKREKKLANLQASLNYMQNKPEPKP